MEENNNAKILYHGSRGGIVGDIKPISRERCDFGRGFYMGTNDLQAKTLVANDPMPYFYKVSLDMSAFAEEQVLNLQDLDWAYFVLYNRNRMESIKGTAFYEKYKHLGDGKDIIIGPIVDDAMNETMKRFMDSQITDKAFLESIRVLNYGIQYVAKTNYACSKISIILEKDLHGKELSDAIELSINQRRQGTELAEDIQKKYRREGQYFDEILLDVSKKSPQIKDLKR